MKESITTALSWIKTNAVRMGLLPLSDVNKREVVRVINTDADDSRTNSLS